MFLYTLSPFITLRIDPQDALWCQVRDGKLAARFDPHAMNQLADLIGEDGEGIYLSLGGRKVRPPLASKPMVWEKPSDHE